MKEIEKKDTPEVSGGYRDEGGCIPVSPLPLELPGDQATGYPKAPNSPWAGPDIFVTDPPAV